MTNNLEILIEITHCKNDILYFVEKYVRVKINDNNIILKLKKKKKRYLQKLYIKINSNYDKTRIRKL